MLYSLYYLSPNINILQITIESKQHVIGKLDLFLAKKNDADPVVFKVLFLVVAAVRNSDSNGGSSSGFPITGNSRQAATTTDADNPHHKNVQFQ
jgi:hypothetical protein